MTERASRRRIRDQMRIDPALLRVVADPIRSFIVYSLVPAAKTARALAAELGCPVTRLYYHLQQLEKHDLVFVERTRLVSGIVEKHYRATARELRLDAGAFGAGQALDKRRTEALLGFVFDQARVEIRRGLDEGRIDFSRVAPEPDSLIAYRNVLKLSPGQAARLYSRLYDFWMEYEQLAREPADDGRFYAFSVALYPNDMGSGAAAKCKPAAGTRQGRAKP